MPPIKDLLNVDLSNYTRVLPDRPINAPENEPDRELLAAIRRVIREELAAAAKISEYERQYGNS